MRNSRRRPTSAGRRPTVWSVTAGAATLAALTAAGTYAVATGPGTVGAEPSAGDADAPAWRQAHTTGDDGSFAAIAAAGPNHVWAFGDDSSQGSGNTWVHRWDGESWRQVEVPSGLQGSPVTADAAGADNVWAAGASPGGDPFALHYNGDTWRSMPLDPEVSPTDIEVAGGDNAWLLSEGNQTKRLVRYDGEQWRDAPAPEADKALAAVDARTLFAVGVDRESGQPTAERWTGSEWQTMDVPDVELPGGEPSASFDDVYARSANDVWAVGSISYSDSEDVNHNLPLLGHWNGEKWTVTTGERDASYAGVTGDGEGGLWIEEDSWNPTFLHRTADGDVTRHEVTDDTYDLSVPSLTHIPGTTRAAAAGTAFEEGDPDVFTDHGVVLTHGF